MVEILKLLSKRDGFEVGQGDLSLTLFSANNSIRRFRAAEPNSLDDKARGPLEYLRIRLSKR